jgi:hypothetical protein
VQNAGTVADNEEILNGENGGGGGRLEHEGRRMAYERHERNEKGQKAMCGSMRGR